MFAMTGFRNILEDKHLLRKELEAMKNTTFLEPSDATQSGAKTRSEGGNCSCGSGKRKTECEPRAAAEQSWTLRLDLGITTPKSQARVCKLDKSILRLHKMILHDESAENTG